MNIRDQPKTGLTFFNDIFLMGLLINGQICWVFKE